VTSVDAKVKRDHAAAYPSYAQSGNKTLRDCWCLEANLLPCCLAPEGYIFSSFCINLSLSLSYLP